MLTIKDGMTKCKCETPANKIHDLLEVLRANNYQTDWYKLRNLLMVFRNTLCHLIKDINDSTCREQLTEVVNFITLHNADADSANPESLRCAIRTVRHSVEPVQAYLRIHDETWTPRYGYKFDFKIARPRCFEFGCPRRFTGGHDGMQPYDSKKDVAECDHTLPF